jgi:hypothetical protein
MSKNANTAAEILDSVITKCAYCDQILKDEGIVLGREMLHPECAKRFEDEALAHELMGVACPF